MVNDINAVSLNDLLFKYADDLTTSVPVKFNSVYVDDVIINNSMDISRVEFANKQQWTDENKMKLNMQKTFEMVVKGRTHPGTIGRDL